MPGAAEGTLIHFAALGADRSATRRIGQPKLQHTATSARRRLASTGLRVGCLGRQRTWHTARLSSPPGTPDRAFGVGRPAGPGRGGVLAGHDDSSAVPEEFLDALNLTGADLVGRNVFHYRYDTDAAAGAAPRAPRIPAAAVQPVHHHDEVHRVGHARADGRHVQVDDGRQPRPAGPGFRGRRLISGPASSTSEVRTPEFVALRKQSNPAELNRQITLLQKPADQAPLSQDNYPHARRNKRGARRRQASTLSSGATGRTSQAGRVVGSSRRGFGLFTRVRRPRRMVNGSRSWSRREVRAMAINRTSAATRQG